MKNFKDPLKTLFKEGNTAILDKLLENFSQLLAFLYDEELSSDEEFSNDFQDILQYSMNLSQKLHKENKWRLQYKLIAGLSK